MGGGAERKLCLPEGSIQVRKLYIPLLNTLKFISNSTELSSKFKITLTTAKEEFSKTHIEQLQIICKLAKLCNKKIVIGSL